MTRLFTLLGIVIALSAAVGLYKVKMRTAELGDQMRAVSREIAREEEAISVLKAEWSLLNQPDRLQALAERYLDLQPIEIGQIIRVNGLADDATSEPDFNPIADDDAPSVVAATE